MSNVENSDFRTLEDRTNRPPLPNLDSGPYPAEVDRLGKLAQAATPGQWSVYLGPMGINSGPHVWIRDQTGALLMERCQGGTQADMEFVVAARNTVPKLLRHIDSLARRCALRYEETRRARKERDDMRVELNRVKRDRDNLDTTLLPANGMDQVSNLRRALMEVQNQRDNALAKLEESGRVRDRLEQSNKDLRDLARRETIEAETQRERADRAKSEADTLNNYMERLEQEANRLSADLFQARTKIEEYGRDAEKRTKVVDKIRQRFDIAPGEDLYEGLCRRVGDLQASEAEQVSAPLKARIAELEQSVQVQDRALDSAAKRVDSITRQVTDMKNNHDNQVAALNRALDSRYQELERSDRRANENKEWAERTEARLSEEIKNWGALSSKLAEVENDRARLQDMVNKVRHMVRDPEVAKAVITAMGVPEIAGVRSYRKILAETVSAVRATVASQECQPEPGAEGEPKA